MKKNLAKILGITLLSGGILLSSCYIFYQKGIAKGKILGREEATNNFNIKLEDLKILYNGFLYSFSEQNRAIDSLSKGLQSSNYEINNYIFDDIDKYLNLDSKLDTIDLDCK